MLKMAVLLLLLLTMMMMMHTMMMGVRSHHRALRPWEEDLQRIRTANIL
jgi:hypothetical protein